MALFEPEPACAAAAAPRVPQRAPLTLRAGHGAVGHVVAAAGAGQVRVARGEHREVGPDCLYEAVIPYAIALLFINVRHQKFSLQNFD